jgi:hypothetical protein
MDKKEMESINKLLDEIMVLPLVDEAKPTLLEISGYPHYENVCSNILAFFFDPEQPHGLDQCLVKSLMLTDDWYDVDHSEIIVEREVTTVQGNRIDLIIESDSHLIAIENKIFHSLSNPFDDYILYLKQRLSGSDKQLHTIILTLLPHEDISEFKVITYDNFFESLKKTIGGYAINADSKFLGFLFDFIVTMENLNKEPEMDDQVEELMTSRKQDVKKVIDLVKNYKAHLRNRTTALRDRLNYEINGITLQPAFYSERDSISDCLYIDIPLRGGTVLAIDTILEPEGWNIICFSRQVSKLHLVKKVLDQMGKDYTINSSQRLEVANFAKNESLGVVAQELQSLLDSITKVAMV